MSALRCHWCLWPCHKKKDPTSDFSDDSFEKQFAACLPEKTDQDKDFLYTVSKIESVNRNHACEVTAKQRHSCSDAQRRRCKAPV